MNSERQDKKHTVEAILQEQLTELENLYQNAPIGLCLLDRDLCYVRINSWLAAYNDRPVIEHIGRSIFDVIPHVAPYIESDLRHVIDTGEALINKELAGKPPSSRASTQVNMLVSYHPLRTDDGFIAGVSIVAQDISALKKIEKHLLAEKKFSDAVIESIPGLFFMLDGKGKILRWNKYAENVLGYSPDDMLSMHALDLIVPADRESVATAIEKALVEGSASAESATLTKDGREIPHFGHGVHINIDGVDYVCGLVIDISARKKVELELDERYRFESLMANIAARFVLLAPENTDRTIEESLRDIAEFVGADRCAMGRIEVDPPGLFFTHFYAVDGVRELSRTINMAEAVPELHRLLSRGETVHFGSLREASDLLRLQMKPFAERGLKSLLAIPLIRGDEVRGLLGVDMLRCEKSWPVETARRLNILGDVFASAITRTEAEKELNKRYEFEMVLTELSARLVNLPVDEIDAEIRSGLQQICDLLHFDQGILTRFSEDLSEAYPEYMYLKRGTPGIESFNLAEQFPQMAELLLQGNVLQFKKPMASGNSLQAEESYFEEAGIKSALGIPVKVTSSGPAVLSFMTYNEELDWSEELIKQLRLVGEIFANALARKISMVKLNERHLFESLLSEMSASFVKSMPERTDDDIETWLGRIAETLNLDRVVLTQYSPDQGMMHVTHSYTAPGIISVRKDYEKGDWNYFTRKLMSGGIVKISQIEDLPEEARAEREYWQNNTVKSLLMIPLMVGDSALGSLVLSTQKRRITWADDLVQRFQLIGSTIANVFERQKSDARLYDRYRFESLVSELSARFVNLPAKLVDEEIERGLKDVVKFFNVDRITLAQISADGSGYVVTHSCAVPPMKPAPRGFDLNEKIPNLARQLKLGEVARIDNIPEAFDETTPERRFFHEVGLMSILNVPLAAEGSILGGLFIGTSGKVRAWSDSHEQRLRLIGELLANVLRRQQSEVTLTNAFSEIRELKEKLEAECFYLREEISLEHGQSEIIGQSDEIRALIAEIRQVAPMDTTVLILGETGTGKELMARAIHRASTRSEKPLVKVNCAALPGELMESELFGHEKGAFTGAHARQVGRFEIAHGTTIFLDEIGELPVQLQSKLLRVLQDGEFEPLGSPRTVKADARIIAATNRDLGEEVRAGRFREDLWYRLNVYPITVPPLRCHKEDIPLLVQYLVAKLSKKMGKTITEIPQGVMEMLRVYAWPGNVRELENVIERAIISSEGSQLRLADRLDTGKGETVPEGAHKSLEEVERQHITAILAQCDWRIEGREGAARILGLNPSTLRGRMRKLKIRRP